jgi:hypothetical protein
VFGSVEDEDEDEDEDEYEDEDDEGGEQGEERESGEYHRADTAGTDDTLATSSDGVGYQVGFSSIDSEDVGIGEATQTWTGSNNSRLGSEQAGDSAGI